ncbi:MAG TPA: endo-1,4-beta-xylanase [Lachnospiraceae bacterium]|nr:endo-1,4-beta-xylanase [Lachnospiraceae bacterium]
MSENKSIAHRKAKCTLRFIDENGNAVTNQTITVKQTNHEFLFGCGAFDVLINSNLPKGEENAQVEDRVNKWLALFNYGTLPFYWGGFEREEGKPETASRMNAAKFLQSHQVTVKGHPLCWHTVCADWLLKYDNETILKKQLDRIHRDMTDFKGAVDMWDVINEVVIMPDFDKYDNAITRICKMRGRVGLIKEVFAAAKEANPKATLLLNDFNTSVSYEILIDGCLEAGVPIDVIGIQSHQHQGYWGAQKVNDVLHRFEQFGLPIHFTENTLISGDIMPAYINDLNDWQVPEWPSTLEGEERQAREVEEMYRILFSHPLVEAITAWDFADGAWLGAPSGVIRKDNSVKPVYNKLKEMIKEEWWTNTQIHTDENGYAVIEGMKGEYSLLWKDKKLTYQLKADSTEKEMQFR